ncbi:unnamed protein product [Rodentolepis nana]|uniref:CLIP1_ZNF domain-containing protein n=1 Tax=Rodentolepis nana TaxID=102285 RepID=A0A0R3TUF6_RODNA|nr:unnamed protein product [Rodentolepis nana]
MHEEFQDKQMQLVTSLETEKRICMERVRRAEKKVERFEKEAHSKQSTHTSSPIQSTVPNGRGTPRTPTGGSTNESYDSQVNFLNSIIVDLHAKNSELEQRLRSAISNPGVDRTSVLGQRGTRVQIVKSLHPTYKFELWHTLPTFLCHVPIVRSDNTGAPSLLLLFTCLLSLVEKYTTCMGTGGKGSGDQPTEKKNKKASETRLRSWCDNCEVFDLHDTEQCPQGGVNSTERRGVLQPKLAKNVTPSVNRLYCDNCGVFDSHTTNECTEDPQETF